MSEQQYFKAHIFCCNNERPADNPRGSCKARGGEELRNYLRARVKEEGLNKEIRVNNSGCLDRCEVGATIVVYPEGVWYTYATKEDADEIIEKHLKGGQHVERLKLRVDQKELTPEQKAARGQ